MLSRLFSTRWTLEIALGVGLVVSLAAGLVAEIRGGGESKAASPPPIRTVAGDKFCLVCPPGSAKTSARLKFALEAMGCEVSEVTPKGLGTMKHENRNAFVAIFLVSEDVFDETGFVQDLGLSYSLHDYARRGGMVVASTSWAPVCFAGPFESFNGKLDWPVRYSPNGVNNYMDVGPMVQIGDRKKRDIRAVWWGGADWKSSHMANCSFDGQRVPFAEVDTVQKRGLKVWCCTEGKPRLPVVVSQMIGKGCVVYSAIDDYEQAEESRRLLRRLVELGRQYQAAAATTRSRPIDHGKR